MKKSPISLWTLSLALALSLAASAALAEEAKPAPAAVSPASPGTAGLGGIYGFAQKNLVGAAEKMPEENYAFKPTPEVRSFGQLVGHMADAQFAMCGTVLGEKGPGRDIEKTKTSKADLVAALKESCALCQKAFRLSDADAAKPVEIFGMKMNGFGLLGLTVGHGMEHYGNMVTYMRMKGLVPPSSEGRPPAADPHAAPKAPEKY